MLYLTTLLVVAAAMTAAIGLTRYLGERGAEARAAVAELKRITLRVRPQLNHLRSRYNPDADNALHAPEAAADIGALAERCTGADRKAARVAADAVHLYATKVREMYRGGSKEARNAAGLAAERAADEAYRALERFR
jgi:hypothetical protein